MRLTRVVQGKGEGKTGIGKHVEQHENEDNASIVGTPVEGLG